VIVDWTRVAGAGRAVDLASIKLGGLVVAASDMHFGAKDNMIMPGRARNMGDGWETRRRREPGNDWAVIALGYPGTIRRIEVDTAHFKGNYPDRCSLQATNAKKVPDEALVTQSMFWPVLLPEQPLSLDAVHVFAEQISDLGAITHVRFNIIPDGGVSRLRLWGQVSPVRR
jgi:allantoicase